MSSEIVGRVTVVGGELHEGLGIETLDGMCTRIVDKGCLPPTKRAITFSTAANDQRQIDIHLLAGDAPEASLCRSLGRIRLVEIPVAPRGVPQIEVGFSIDENGLVETTAKDLATGNRVPIQIASTETVEGEDFSDFPLTFGVSFRDPWEKPKEAKAAPPSRSPSVLSGWCQIRPAVALRFLDRRPGWEQYLSVLLGPIGWLFLKPWLAAVTARLNPYTIEGKNVRQIQFFEHVEKGKLGTSIRIVQVLYEDPGDGSQWVCAFECDEANQTEQLLGQLATFASVERLPAFES
jgi:hypothetical protein